MRRVLAAFVVLVLSSGVMLGQTTKSEPIKLSVPGMHCDNCAQKIDKALRGVEGVNEVKVDLESRTAEVMVSSASVKTESLVKAVSDAGYAAELATAASGTAKEKNCPCCSGKAGHKHQKGAAMQDDCCKNKKKTGTKS